MLRNRRAFGSGVFRGRRDSIAPTCTITSTSSGAVAGAFTCTFTFSEDVTGFALGDITVGNGTAGTFATVSASVYTAVITPSATGNVTVDVNANVCIDAAGNNNTAATQFSILYIAGATFHFDFSDISSLYQDSAGTTPVTADGQVIGKATDKSGNNRHALQAGADGLKPVYKAAIQNGRAVARFDGSDDILSASIPADASCSVFVVAKKRSAASVVGKAVGGFAAGGADATIYVKSSDGSGWLWYANEANGVVSFGGNPENWTLLQLDFANLDSATPNLNGVAGTEFDPRAPYSEATSFGLGAVSAGLYGDYDIGEFFLFGSVLSAPNAAALRSALSTKWDF